MLSRKINWNIFINSGLTSFVSQFNDSSNATFIRFTAPRLVPSTKNKVFQLSRYNLWQISTIVWGFVCHTLRQILQWCLSWLSSNVILRKISYPIRLKMGKKPLISIHILDGYEYRSIRAADPKSHNTVKKLIRGNYGTVVEAILVKPPDLRVNPN